MRNTSWRDTYFYCGRFIVAQMKNFRHYIVWNILESFWNICEPILFYIPIFWYIRNEKNYTYRAIQTVVIFPVLLHANIKAISMSHRHLLISCRNLFAQVCGYHFHLWDEVSPTKFILFFFSFFFLLFLSHSLFADCVMWMCSRGFRETRNETRQTTFTCNIHNFY